MSILLKGGRVLDPSQNKDTVADVLIENGQIKAIDAAIPESSAKEVITLTPEQWVTPGLVDIHVHFRDPGNPEKETIRSGSQSAIEGGFTTVCCMPNTQPRLDTAATLEYVRTTAARDSHIEILPVAAATKNLDGKELTEMAELKAYGAVGFSDDGHCIMNSRLMRLVLEYTAMLDLPFVCHAEDRHMSEGGCMNEGPNSIRLGLKGIHNTSESIIVGRDIQLLRAFGGRIHFAHISTQESVALIRQAKAEGLAITAETAPHYIALTDDCLEHYDGDYKMNAPLRREADRQALIEALKDGTIDCLATDHAPHTPDEKQRSLDDCPNGVIGLETSLAASITYLLKPGHLTPLQLIDKLSTAGARCMGLSAGRLTVGQAANIAVIDPEQAWVVEPRRFKSLSRNCPFKGQTLLGQVQWVMANGQVVKDQRMSPERSLVTV